MGAVEVAARTSVPLLRITRRAAQRSAGRTGVRVTLSHRHQAAGVDLEGRAGRERIRPGKYRRPASRLEECRRCPAVADRKEHGGHTRIDVQGAGAGEGRAIKNQHGPAAAHLQRAAQGQAGEGRLALPGKVQCGWRCDGKRVAVAGGQIGADAQPFGLQVGLHLGELIGAQDAVEDVDFRHVALGQLVALVVAAQLKLVKGRDAGRIVGVDGRQRSEAVGQIVERRRAAVIRDGIHLGRGIHRGICLIDPAVQVKLIGMTTPPTDQDVAVGRANQPLVLGVVHCGDGKDGVLRVGVVKARVQILAAVEVHERLARSSHWPRPSRRSIVQAVAVSTQVGPTGDVAGRELAGIQLLDQTAGDRRLDGGRNAERAAAEDDGACAQRVDGSRPQGALADGGGAAVDVRAGKVQPARTGLDEIALPKPCPDS